MKRITFGLCAGLLALQVSAQNRSDEMDRAFLEQQCKPELRKMLVNLGATLPDVQVAGREEQICSCARDRLFHDKALSMIRDADKQPLDPRLKLGDAKLQTYMFLKTTAAMHGCYASEFESLARTLDPLK